MIRLFDIQNGKVTPTEHCYTLDCLKVIMDRYPDNYISVYAYIFYMSCPNPDLNPFFEVPDLDKEEVIRTEVKGDFDSEDDDIQYAINFCRRLYETPTQRAYNGIKGMLERLAKYMELTDITDGRDGNITALVNAATKFESIRQSYKGALKDLENEQKSTVRGGQNLGYDQK